MKEVIMRTNGLIAPKPDDEDMKHLDDELAALLEALAALRASGTAVMPGHTVVAARGSGSAIALSR